MNNFESNFKTYFTRHCLHYINVIQDPNHIRFMDLTHSLRCLLDVKTELDELYSTLGVKLRFKHQVNRRKVRKSISSDEKTFDEITTESVTYQSSGFFSRTLDDEELNRIFNNLELVEPQYANKVMKFTEWLAVEVGSIEDKGIVYRVRREDFIRRIANKFGGSHPHETEFNLSSDKNQEMINRFVDRTMAIKLPTIEQGYLSVKIYSEEMINAFLPIYCDELNEDPKNIFNYCNKLLNY